MTLETCKLSTRCSFDLKGYSANFEIFDLFTLNPRLRATHPPRGEQPLCKRLRNCSVEEKNQALSSRMFLSHCERRRIVQALVVPQRMFLVIAAESFYSRTSKAVETLKERFPSLPLEPRQNMLLKLIVSPSLDLFLSTITLSDKYSPPHLIDPNQSSTPHPLVPIRFLLFCQSLTPSSTTSLLFRSDPRTHFQPPSDREHAQQCSEREGQVCVQCDFEVIWE